MAAEKEREPDTVIKMPTPKETLKDSFMKIAVVVAAYWVVSISMVFLNSYLLSSKDVKLDAPLFITFSQCVTGVVCLFLLSKFGSGMQFLDEFPAFQISTSLMLQLLPLSAVFVGMIAFNNLCLKYVGVAFYNVGRSLTTIFNVVLSYLILRQGTSPRAIICCSAIIGGFLLGVKQENKSATKSGNDSDLFLGVFFGVSASCCVALNAIFTKKFLPLVEGNLWRLQMYNNLNASLLFLPLIFIFGEFSVLMKYPKLSSLSFWGMMLLSGVMGIAIAYVTGLQIRVTSPLTHNVSGTAKACAQTVLAVVWASQYKSFLWWVSNVMVMCGSAAYTFVRQREMQIARAQEAAQASENKA
ncbi:GDP-fucose transporter 1-like [Sycon ciliatum]|uniref:GDP-fucose transporter 1-like n=1 Tax=Sycon ciliatum TaxID=27933 RepID=UPI0031F6921A